MKSTTDWLWATTFIACSALPLPAWGDASDAQLLRNEYQEIRNDLRDGAIGIPVYVRSGDRNDLLNADVYGILDYPLSAIVETLATPVNWCEFSTLHPNIKACTQQQHDSQVLLALYVGRKSAGSPDDAFELKLSYRVLDLDDDYFKVLLEGDEGPLGTRDHRFQVEAVTVEDKTFARVRFSYRARLISKMATNMYLATWGRRKVGFSIIGVNDAGKPIYVKGKKGIVERHAVRSYFALMAFMNTRHLPTKEQFEARISYWFDLTEKCLPQLYDMKKEEYIDVKRRERAHQLRLQSPLAKASNAEI